MREVPGIDPCEASDADEAVALVLRGGTDVVVLDLHMPGKSGFDILPALRAAPARPTIVVLTSHPTEHHKRQCIALGADYFFDKARDFARVIDVILRPTRPTNPSDG